jgi:hypothetical protein
VTVKLKVRAIAALKMLEARDTAVGGSPRHLLKFLVVSFLFAYIFFTRMYVELLYFTNTKYIEA